MYKLVITDLAVKDLNSITDYIAQSLANPMAAASFLNEAEKCYEHLQSNPFIYAKSNDLRLSNEGFYRAPIKNYLLLFKIDQAMQTVIIYRFFYSAQNYTRLL